MIPKEKNCLNKKQLGAVLLSETIYEEGEDFGEFTDAEILKLTNSETGMGQYSRAFVVAHTNVLLDFEKTCGERYRQGCIMQHLPAFMWNC